MERIVILGSAGTGKTTLAYKLGEITDARVICLDAIWNEDVPAFRALMEEAHAGERWISDGNFAIATFDIRLPRATLIVWLERSKLSSSWRVVRRVFKRGEPHRFRNLRKVLAFIWRFDRVNRPRIEEHRMAHGPDVPVLRLRSRRDIDAFLSKFRNPKSNAPPTSNRG